MGSELPQGESGAEARLRAAFERVRNPMLIVDDQRRYVTANAPACGLLGMASEELPWHRIDDFTPVQDRKRLAEQWDAFLVNGGMEGWFHLCLPDGSLVPIEFSATANVLPGRHLSVVMPLGGAADDADGEARREVGWTRFVARDDEQVPLTAREHEVIALVATGLHGGEIAARLGVSPETIKSHVQNAMSKLGAHTRAHAVAIALSTGQLDLHEGAGHGLDQKLTRNPSPVRAISSRNSHAWGMVDSTESLETGP
jgi:PAS domain S-box-containing protein